MGHNWGSSLLHPNLTDDPPFCTHYTQNPKIWLATASWSGTDQRMLLWELTLYNVVSNMCNVILSLISRVSKMKKANPGPSNIHEAEDYSTKLNGLFDGLMDMLRKDKRDALETMIKNVKRHIQGTWTDMMSAWVDVTVLTIKDPLCTLLRESIDQEPVTTSDPDDETPMGEDMMKMLPHVQSQAVKEECINLFKNLSVATHHISIAMANLAALAKKVDPETFRIILKASAWPLVQINLNEETLDPTRDKPVKSQQEARDEKIKQDILPNPTNTRLNREPANSSTRLLTAAIYFKLKKYLFNKGTQTETATKFKVKIKALGQILSGKHYLGERDWKTAQKQQEEEEHEPQKKRKRAVISSDEDWNHHLEEKQVNTPTVTVNLSFSQVSGG